MPQEPEDRISRKRSKLEAALKALRGKERARRHKRDAIAGRAVLARAERDPSYRQDLMRVLDAELTRGSERALFGLSVPDTGGRRGQPEPVTEEPPPPWPGTTTEPAA